MKKSIMLSLALSVCFFAASATARVRNIVEWDGGENPYKQGDRDITGEKFESSCSKVCPGYSLTTTFCPSGSVLIHCPASGCGYYNKCQEDPSAAESKDSDVNMEEINIEEVYNSIIEEQKAAAEAANKNK